MTFDYKKARMELWRRQRKENRLMREAGMSEQDIKELNRMSSSELYHDIYFYGYLDGYIDSLDDLPDSGYEMRLGIMDEIENQDLLKAIKALKAKERLIFFLHILDGFSLKEISLSLGKPYTTVASIFDRAKKKMKKF